MCACLRGSHGESRCLVRSTACTQVEGDGKMSGGESRGRKGADPVEGQHGAGHAALGPFGPPAVPEGTQTFLSLISRHLKVLFVPSILHFEVEESHSTLRGLRGNHNFYLVPRPHEIVRMHIHVRVPFLLVVDPAGSGARHAEAGKGEGEGAGGTDEADVDTAGPARDGAAPADGAAAPPLEVRDRLEQQHAQRGGSVVSLVNQK